MRGRQKTDCKIRQVTYLGRQWLTEGQQLVAGDIASDMEGLLHYFARVGVEQSGRGSTRLCLAQGLDHRKIL